MLITSPRLEVCNLSCWHILISVSIPVKSWLCLWVLWVLNCLHNNPEAMVGIVLPGGKKLRLNKFSIYEFGFVTNIVLWLWLWKIHMDRNTYTIKSKCHKVAPIHENDGEETLSLSRFLVYSNCDICILKVVSGACVVNRHTTMD